MVVMWTLVGYLCTCACDKPEMIRKNLQVDERVE